MKDEVDDENLARQGEEQVLEPRDDAGTQETTADDQGVAQTLGAAATALSPTNLIDDSNVVDLDVMKDAVFFLYPDRKIRLSRFFLLIFLSAVIATSGVASDSAATVIGAMIVAPLMTPILGTMLGMMLGDGRNCALCFALVVSGAGLAILVGYVYGLFLEDVTIYAENNSQIAGRVKPKLTDLIGALATGAVGSIALIRKDVAGTLPGVAIAISLVPPLNVVGLTLSTGRGTDAKGALLLFATNFASIVLLGVIVMAIYKVPLMVEGGKRNCRTSFILMLGLLIVVAIPLGISSKQIRDLIEVEGCVRDRANEYAEAYNWTTNVVIAKSDQNTYTAEVLVAGEPPFPDPEDFPQAFSCNVESLTVAFLPEKTVEF